MSWINLQEYLQKPMIEQTWQEELLGCLIIFGALALIWLIGEIIYRIERRRNEKS